MFFVLTYPKFIKKFIFSQLKLQGFCKFIQNFLFLTKILRKTFLHAIVCAHPIPRQRQILFLRICLQILHTKASSNLHSIVFKMSLKHKRALFLKSGHQNIETLFLKKHLCQNFCLQKILNARRIIFLTIVSKIYILNIYV